MSKNKLWVELAGNGQPAVRDQPALRQGTAGLQSVRDQPACSQSGMGLLPQLSGLSAAPVSTNKYSCAQFNQTQNKAELTLKCKQTGELHLNMLTQLLCSSMLLN